MKTALPRALELVCVLASLVLLAGCEPGFGAVLHKPPSGGGGAAPSVYTPDILPLTLPMPERAGCEFSGWYENEGLTGNPVPNIPAGSTGDKTFWAKWREISHTIDGWYTDATLLVRAVPPDVPEKAARRHGGLRPVSLHRHL
ncbi:MAG: InlB B-repeat-containing protein [Treponematales bacterium]